MGDGRELGIFGQQNAVSSLFGGGEPRSRSADEFGYGLEIGRHTAYYR